jgi:hypothetical protein
MLRYYVFQMKLLRVLAATVPGLGTAAAQVPLDLGTATLKLDARCAVASFAAGAVEGGAPNGPPAFALQTGERRVAAAGGRRAGDRVEVAFDGVRAAFRVRTGPGSAVFELEPMAAKPDRFTLLRMRLRAPKATAATLNAFRYDGFSVALMSAPVNVRWSLEQALAAHQTVVSLPDHPHRPGLLVPVHRALRRRRKELSRRPRGPATDHTPVPGGRGPRGPAFSAGHRYEPLRLAHAVALGLPPTDMATGHWMRVWPAEPMRRFVQGQGDIRRRATGAARGPHRHAAAGALRGAVICPPI